MPFHSLSRRLLLPGGLLLLLLPVIAGAEYYSYEDRSGTIHFVDDEGKIPAEYRQQKQVRKDEFDDLSVEERSHMQEKVRRERETAQRRDSVEQERLRKSRLEKEQREALERQQREMTTAVVIRGRQVFVPVRLTSGSGETEAMLLLDTGATTSVISPEVAARLSIDKTDNTKARVVGGRELRVKKTVLKRLQVGPVIRDEQEVMIIYERGGGFGDGLLGMSFLAGLKYTIDFQKQTLNWLP